MKTKINYQRQLRHSNQLYQFSQQISQICDKFTKFSKRAEQRNKHKHACDGLKLGREQRKSVREAHKIILPVSYLHAAPFLSLQTRDQAHLDNASVHRVGESTAALMYTVLLKSGHSHGFISVTGRVTSPVVNLLHKTRTPVAQFASISQT